MEAHCRDFRRPRYVTKASLSMALYLAHLWLVGDESAYQMESLALGHPPEHQHGRLPFVCVRVLGGANQSPSQGLQWQ